MTSKLPNNSSLWNTPIFLPLSLSVFLLISGFAVSPIWDPIILEIANTDSQQASYQWSFVDPAIRHSWTWWNSFTPLLWVSVLVTFLVIHTPSSVLVIHTPSSVLVILSVGFWDFSLTLHPTFLSSWFVLLVLAWNQVFESLFLVYGFWLILLGPWLLVLVFHSWSLILDSSLFGLCFWSRTWIFESWCTLVWLILLGPSLGSYFLLLLLGSYFLLLLLHSSSFILASLTLHPSSWA